MWYPPGWGFELPRSKYVSEPDCLESLEVTNVNLPPILRTYLPVFGKQGTTCLSSPTTLSFKGLQPQSLRHQADWGCYTPFYLSQALSKVPIFCFLKPHSLWSWPPSIWSQEHKISPGSCVPIMYEADSMTSNSPMWRLAEVSQLLNFLNVSVTPYAKRNQ